MRRGGRGSWGRSAGSVPLALALALGLLGSVAHAEGPSLAPWAGKGGGWWKSWFGSGEKPEEQPAPEEELTSLPPSPAERIAAERDRQLRALLRRLAVCDQLKRIAIDTNNDALQQQAIDLEDRVFAIYRQHTDHLMTAGPAIFRDDSASRNHPASNTSRPLGDLGRHGSGGEGTR